MVSMDQPWANMTALGPKAGWAHAVEEEEAAAGGKLQTPAAAQDIDDEAFPTLGAAVSKPAASKKKKPAKGVKMAIGDFNLGARDDRSILQNLPKAPRGEGEQFDDRGGHGGYDRGNRGGFGGGGGGGFDRDGNRGFDRDEFKPSVADSSSDWGADRKPFVPHGGRDGGFGGGSRGGFGSGAPSDGKGWERGSNFQPSRPAFSEGFSGRADDGGQWERGSQFQQHHGQERGHREDFHSSRADDDSNWGRAKMDRPQPEARRESGFGGGSGQADTEERWSRGTVKPAAPSSDRARSNERSADGDRWGRKEVPPAPEAVAAKPTGERPRLNLAPRTKPLPDQVTNIAETKSSIFGDARPREAVLKEQGRDYLEEERSMEAAALEQRERKPTKEERVLQEEVEHLRTRIEAGEADVEVEVEMEGPSEEGAAQGRDEDTAPAAVTVQKLLEQKEAELVKLSAEMDEKMKNKKDQPRPAKKERESASDASAWKKAPPPAADKSPSPTPPAPAADVPAPESADTNDSGEKENAENADNGDGFQEVAARGSKTSRTAKDTPPRDTHPKDREGFGSRAHAPKERREHVAPAPAASKGPRW